jgi:hypothetical protein
MELRENLMYGITACSSVKVHKQPWEMSVA